MNISFRTSKGVSFSGDSLELINNKSFIRKYKNKINLIFTSPPFSLLKKKKYGNKNGDVYIEWFKQFAKPLSDLLTDDGSIVIELGNSWEKGSPIFSTVPIESLLAFKNEANLHLCQEFICYNPSRPPNSAEWVTIKRIRVKDSYTRIWWMSKTPYPKSDNKKILVNYSEGMRRLIKRNNLHTGTRPSGYKITSSFLKNKNKGSISPNFLSLNEQEFIHETLENSLTIPNNDNQKVFYDFCKKYNFQQHPARMQASLAEYFIRFLTDEKDIVFDPFSGSNTTGIVSQNLKRKWIACEKEIDYIKSSTIRFFDESEAKNTIKRMAK
jgi:DNA modification methylase